MNNDIQEIKEKIGVSAKGIIIQHLHLEQIGGKYRCPDKMAHRHGDRNPSMSWDNDHLQFKCFGCGKLLDIYSLYRHYLNYPHSEIVSELLGKERLEDTHMAKNRAAFQDQAMRFTPLTEAQINYLKARKLDEDTISYFKLQNHQGLLAFPYIKNGILIGAKTRKPEKHSEGPKYLSLPGSKPGLFNYDNTTENDELIICEGEIDCMIIHQAGFPNVVSVGAGANSLASLVEQHKEFFDCFESLIIFSDNDDAGSNMDEQFLNAFPKKTRLIDKTLMKRKDANEEYLYEGPSAIRLIIESAVEKIEGFFNPDTDTTSLQEVFNRGRFIPTGLPKIDEALNDLAPGCTTLIAGRSNGGKSTFINQVVANAINTKNKVLLISGEDDKRILVSRIYKAVIGRDATLYDEVQINKKYIKIPKAETLKRIKHWHKDRLRLFMKGETSLRTTDQLFDIVSRRIKLDKYNLVVIDNLMSVLTVKSANEKNDAQADFMQKCCDIAKLYHCHIIIVLHPNKTFRKGDQMDFEQISGTSDLANKADNVLAIIREYDADQIKIGIDGYCEILKNRYYPDLKKVPLHYDIETGLLLEVDEDTGKCANYKFNV